VSLEGLKQGKAKSRRQREEGRKQKVKKVRV
jgi:hypothetical protein